MAVDPAGGLTVGNRLDRIEGKLETIILKLEVFAKATDVEKLDTRVVSIERSYVGRGTLWGLVAVVVAQFLVILGLGLGYVYEILRPPTH